MYTLSLPQMSMHSQILAVSSERQFPVAGHGGIPQRGSPWETVKCQLTPLWRFPNRKGQLPLIENQNHSQLNERDNHNQGSCSSGREDEGMETAVRNGYQLGAKGC